jgi:hypothetical protein
VSPRYVRNVPGPQEDLLAGSASGVVAACVGLVVFCYVRLFVARESMDGGGGANGAAAETGL